jgi:hypothetical protein
MCDFDFIKCRLIKNKIHLLENAKLIPCGNSGCLKCIHKVMNKTNYLKCNFQNCKERHVLNDVKKLPDNFAVKNYIEKNLEEVANQMFTSAKEGLCELQGIIYILIFILNCQKQNP